MMHELVIYLAAHPLILMGLSLVLFSLFCLGCLLYDRRRNSQVRDVEDWPPYESHPPATFSKPAHKGFHRPTADEFQRRRLSTAAKIDGGKRAS